MATKWLNQSPLQYVIYMFNNQFDLVLVRVLGDVLIINVMIL